MSVREYLQQPNLARFPFAFIVTYGRSGSTLLQGILNSIPGYCIRGENYSALFYLFVATEHLAEAHTTFGQHKTGAGSSWFGAELFEPQLFAQRLADAFLDTCLQPTAGARCVGFKEIRYLQSQIPDELFPAYLDFLQTVFPNAALIFNVRDIANTAKSGWWQDRDFEQVKEQLTGALERFKSYAAGRSNCTLFNYDLLLAEPRYCESLFDFLGEPFDSAALENLLVRRHGYEMQRRTTDAAAKGPVWQEQSLSVEAGVIANLRASLEAKSEELKVKSAEMEELRKRNVSQSLRIQELRETLQDRDEKLLDLTIRRRATRT